MTTPWLRKIDEGIIQATMHTGHRPKLIIMVPEVKRALLERITVYPAEPRPELNTAGVVAGIPFELVRDQDQLRAVLEKHEALEPRDLMSVGVPEAWYEWVCMGMRMQWYEWVWMKARYDRLIEQGLIKRGPFEFLARR